MAPLCDEGFGPESESDIGGIGRLFNEAPLRRYAKAVIPKAIPADVHRPDEAALSAIRNCKCDSSFISVELSIAVVAGHLSPGSPSGAIPDGGRSAKIHSCGLCGVLFATLV
jgi:hypothetical protein